MADDFKMYTIIHKSLIRISNELEIIQQAVSDFCEKFEKESKYIKQNIDEELIIRNLNDFTQKTSRLREVF